MDEQPTPETAVTFVFHLIHLVVSLYISWFILCIETIMILCIHLCYLHCLDFIYLCLTIIV